MRVFIACLLLMSQMVWAQSDPIFGGVKGDRHWRAPVASVAALPATGNSTGDARVETTNFSTWMWNGAAWTSGGTVFTVSVVSANGFAGTVTNPTTTPAITLSTTVTGILKGNGTAISAAVSGTDYEPPITAGTTLQYYRGDKTFQTLDTLACVENTNLYFTPARARATLSVDGGADPLAYNSGTGQFSMPAATTAQNGYLAQADWNTFNGKQSALTFGSISTSTTGVTVGNGANSTVGPAVTVNVQSATTAQPGLLTAADWNTFNGKQAALGFTPENVANKSTITTLGTSDTLFPSQNAVKVYVDTAVGGSVVNLAGPGVSGILPVAHGGANLPTKRLYVDKTRTDVYTPDGSQSRPFLAIQTAINQIATNADNITYFYVIDVAPATYAENLSFASTNLYYIFLEGHYLTSIVPGSGNSIDSSTNNANLFSLLFHGFSTTGPINLVGDTTASQFCRGGCNFIDHTHSGNVVITNAATSTFLGDVSQAFNGSYTATNVTSCGMIGGQGILSSPVTLVTNAGANKPIGFSTTFMVVDHAVMTSGTITMDSGSIYIFRNGARIGAPGGAITIAGTSQFYNATIRSNLSLTGGILTANDTVIPGSATISSGATLVANQSSIMGTCTVNAGGTLTLNGSFCTGTLTQNGTLNINNKITQMTGTLAIANGGTGQITAAAAFNALNPMTTTGDLIYESGAATASRLAAGTANSVLTMVGTTPAWSTVNLTTGITGVLPIANGGTNNSSAYTAGSILFSNGSSVVQDNANFFWDSTNKQLSLHGHASTAVLGLLATGSQFGIDVSSTSSATTVSISNQGTPVDLVLTNATNSVGTLGAQLTTRQSRGTLASPTGTVNGDHLGTWNFLGFTSAGAWGTGNTAFIESQATETFNATSNGGELVFATTPNTTTTPVTRMIIGPDGLLQFNAYNSAGVLLTDASGNVSTNSTLSVVRGGTGQSTVAAAFNALNPMTTTGDMIYESSTGVASRLGIGSTGQVLTVAGGIPSWAAGASGGGSGSGGIIFQQSGGLSIMDDFGNPAPVTAATSISSVTAAICATGVAGQTTTFSIKQYTGTTLDNTVTGSIAGTGADCSVVGSGPFQGTVSLSGTLTVAAGDTLIANLTAVAGGAQDLTLSASTASNISTFTGTAVPFSNGSGILTQDVAKLFWDDVNFLLSAFSITTGGGTTATNAGVVLNNGHLKSTQTTPPVAAVQAGAGGGGTCVLSNATDMAGTVTLTAGTITLASGAECILTWNKSYNVAPICVMWPVNSATALAIATIGEYTTSTTTTMSVNFGAAPVTTVVYAWNYHCVETQ